MATLTIKNIPDELYERLKQSAAQQRRSLNSQALVCFEKVMESSRINPEEFLANVRAQRQQISGLFVTEEDINKAKNEGRL